MPPTPPVAPASYLRRIESAKVYDVAIQTPLDWAPLLSERTGHTVWLKREDLQSVFSFKLRGAYNRMANLTAEELFHGVITASAGNHAQGVALGARKLGCKATIVVPVTTPQIKQDAIRALGADLILHGDSYDDAYAHALKLGEERNLTFVHPYDHPDVIAGQGTVGLEICKQHPGPIHAIFVPVGGGGLIAGIALAVKYRSPTTKIIGVEPEDSDAMNQSLKAGRRVTLDRVGALADGVAVRTVGEETFRICQSWVDEIITVTNDEICAAVKEIFEDRRAILEPSGALAYAGLRKYAEPLPPPSPLGERAGVSGPSARESRETTTPSARPLATVHYPQSTPPSAPSPLDRRPSPLHLVAVASGANLNFDRLRYIAERAEVGERREAIFAIHIPETAGSFRKLCTVFGDRNITEFNYRMGDRETATVFAGIQVHGPVEVTDLLKDLQDHGYDAVDLTDNELAKTHLRHMVGGRSHLASDERLFHFDFPERSGALGRFLEGLAGQWNISLFHYRNHGSDRGRVLVGLQIPTNTAQAFEEFRHAIGYPSAEETHNPALKLFL